MEGRPMSSAKQPSDKKPSGKQAPILSVSLQHRVGTVSLDVAFTLTQPWTVLFGPSGTGKTTMLRAIQGHIHPDAGRIAHGTTVLVDRTAKIFLPSHERPVRSAGQNARLFPALNVIENMGYGVKPRTDGSGAALIDDVLERFRLRSLAYKLPNELSGGERQRVAVIRAATSAVSLGPGTLLLLDEPFNGLDLARQEEMRAELRDWLVDQKIPVLSVTHDIAEAFHLGAEVIRIAEGKVVAQGPVTKVLAEDRQRLIDQLRDQS
jgi:molybdate transport system ATP-binding protein